MDIGTGPVVTDYRYNLGNHMKVKLPDKDYAYPRDYRIVMSVGYDEENTNGWLLLVVPETQYGTGYLNVLVRKVRDPKPPYEGRLFEEDEFIPASKWGYWKRKGAKGYGRKWLHENLVRGKVFIR